LRADGVGLMCSMLGVAKLELAPNETKSIASEIPYTWKLG